MDIKEAAAIVRQKWNDASGCGSCGWKSALHEYEPMEDRINQDDIDRGYVQFPCAMDAASDNPGHRGIRIYLRE